MGFATDTGLVTFLRCRAVNMEVDDRGVGTIWTACSMCLAIGSWAANRLVEGCTIVTAALATLILMAYDGGERFRTVAGATAFVAQAMAWDVMEAAPTPPTTVPTPTLTPATVLALTVSVGA